LLASYNRLQVPIKKIQERTTQRRARIDYQGKESERNEFKTVDKIRYLSAPIICQKNIPFETIVQIA
jgi:hypothetical protein